MKGIFCCNRRAIKVSAPGIMVSPPYTTPSMSMSKPCAIVKTIFGKYVPKIAVFQEGSIKFRSYFRRSPAVQLCVNDCAERRGCRPTVMVYSLTKQQVAPLGQEIKNKLHGHKQGAPPGHNSR